MFHFKKSILFLFMFTLKTSVFLVLLLDLFPVFMGKVSQRQAQASGQPGGSCEQISSEIPRFCSQHKSLDEAQARNTALADLTDLHDDGAAQKAAITQAAAQDTQFSLELAKKVCNDANNHCKTQCDQEISELNNLLTGCRYHYTPGTCDPVPGEIQKRQTWKQQCNQEFQTAQAKFNFSLSEIAKLLGGIASLLGALGYGGDEEEPTFGGDENEDDDICKGPYASSIPKCGGGSDPTNGGRPIVTGGPRPGLTTGGPNPFQVSQSSGEPGGERGDGNNGGGAGAGSGSGGGLGGFGAMGDSGLAAAENGESEGGSEEDDPGSYGYMGAGGGGSGGGGSGGFGRGLGNFGKFAVGSSDKPGSGDDLDKQLKRYSSGNTRAPASVGGGLNGPFQDNWKVVKEAYKRNSDTLLKR